MHPILIAGAALVGLPILLHFLLKQEPKKLVFPALRFLKLKQKTSERKMRLKHIVLLLLRCLLIALFALTLYQPVIFTAGTFQLSGDQPVAAVIVVDTSPTMGYAVLGESRLDGAVRAAIEFLDELPENSRVAILESNDAVPSWEPTTLEARNRLKALKAPSGSAPPITSTLLAAYQLMKSADADLPEGADPLPRVLAVFSDRTANAWNAARAEELKAVRDAVPPPKVLHLFFDVGVSNPVNIAILGAEMQPQLLSGGADATIALTVRAEGSSEATEVRLLASVDDAAPVERVIQLAPGTPRRESFAFPGLATGFHKVIFRIDREDALMFDNERTVAFEVAAKRKILTVTDDAVLARAWHNTHAALQQFDDTVVLSDAALDLAGVEAVCLLGIAKPSAALVKSVEDYVQSGGKVLFIPDGPDAGAERAKVLNDAFGNLLPMPLGDLAQWEVPNKDASRKLGVAWKLTDDADFKHPLLAPLAEWRKQGNLDLFDPSSRRLAVKYRKPGGAIPANSTVVAKFDDNDVDAERSPALVERRVGAGTTLMLTTRFDFDASDDKKFWNDYAKNDGHSWAVVFPWLAMRYLVGSPEDAKYNFPAGSDVSIRLPANGAEKFRLSGPGIAEADSKVARIDRQSELRLTGLRTIEPGAYALVADGSAEQWEYRFALFPSAEESTLAKVPEADIEVLFGPNSVAGIDRKVILRDLIDQRLDRRVELFPFLLLLVLLFFVAEGFAANRFYRRA